jgi:hypothetical protein
LGATSSCFGSESHQRHSKLTLKSELYLGNKKVSAEILVTLALVLRSYVSQLPRLPRKIMDRFLPGRPVLE